MYVSSWRTPPPHQLTPLASWPPLAGWPPYHLALSRDGWWGRSAFTLAKRTCSSVNQCLCHRSSFVTICCRECHFRSSRDLRLKKGFLQQVRWFPHIAALKTLGVQDFEEEPAGADNNQITFQVFSQEAWVNRFWTALFKAWPVKAGFEPNTIYMLQK